jgi:acyl-CoA thioester hydrolase
VTEARLPESPDDYPVRIEFDIHWGDMDAFGHANNARYLTWFESCRTAYFRRIGLRIVAPSAVGPIIAHTSCDYLSPIVYPARLTCGASVSKLGNTSFTMRYGLWPSDAPGALAARGEAVIVLLDYRAKQKVRIGDEMRRAIEATEGRPLTPG